MASKEEVKVRGGQARGSVAIPGIMALLGLFLVSFLHLSPTQADREVTAIFAPHISFDEAAARINDAGAVVLTAGSVGNVVTARLGEHASIQALKDAGAWLILSATNSGLCTASGWTRGQGTTTAL